MADAFFVTLTVLVAYIYGGYHLLLFLLAKIFPRVHFFDERHEPTVALIVSAHNEAKDIAAKLQNALETEYPHKKLTVLVVSDGSTDGTDEIVRSFASRGVVLVRPPERRGKTAGLNLALSGVMSDVVVFSDANAIYDRCAVRLLIRHFADPTVGYVVGYASYESTSETAAGSSEGAYWNLEVKLKEWESALSSVVGGDGAIYAIRRNLYEPLQESDINDFVNPLQIVVKGYRGIFDPQARCSEKPAGVFEKEFSRKVRIANRSFHGVLRVSASCNPLKVGIFAWQVMSHKVLRWFSPFIIGLHLVASLTAAGKDGVVPLLALASLGAYGTMSTLALVGWFQEKSAKQARVFFLPYYLVLMNVASAAGIILRLRGTVISVWDTVRGPATGRPPSSALVPFALAGMVLAVAVKLATVLGVYVLQVLEP